MRINKIGAISSKSRRADKSASPMTDVRIHLLISIIGPKGLTSMSESDLQQLISERIQRDGPITFAEYMRMALYEPEYGYYVTGAAKMGWEADYFTSTDVSSLFANCMGRQLFAMWEKLKRPGHFIVLEQGAGRGHLAEGVRSWAQKEAPEFYEVLDYRTEDIRGGADATATDEVEQSTMARYSTQSEAGNISSRYPNQNEEANVPV